MVIDSNEVILFGEMLPSPHQCGVNDINVLSLQVRVVIFACTARLGSSVTVDHLIIFFLTVAFQLCLPSSPLHLVSITLSPNSILI